jgi:hypothetical protein
MTHDGGSDGLVEAVEDAEGRGTWGRLFDSLQAGRRERQDDEREPRSMKRMDDLQRIRGVSTVVLRDGPRRGTRTNLVRAAEDTTPGPSSSRMNGMPTVPRRVYARGGLRARPVLAGRSRAQRRL